MFVNNSKVLEQLKITEAIAPAVAASKSSSELVDMSAYGKYVAIVSQGAVTTAGNLVVKLYESTASTWNGAVATLITASVKTVSVQTSSSSIATVELDASDLSGDNQYVGLHVTNADGDVAAISAVHVRGNGRYGAN